MTKLTRRPNLFTHATSELSQDAFLCWLLEWAGEDLAAMDQGMHEAGKAFVELLYKPASPPPLLPKIQVHRQLKNCDIVAVVGEHHVIVIEDKVHADEHRGQLERYRAALGTIEDYKHKEIHFVFLKTGDQSSYSPVEEKGWTVVKRQQLLEVLNRTCIGTPNTVLHDFREHLEYENRKMQDFASASREQWKPNSAPWDDGETRNATDLWKGFFAWMQERFEGNWRYVNNKSGGFMAFWWAVRKRKDERYKLYLQLQEEELVVKVKTLTATETQKPDMTKLRELSRLIVEGLSQSGFVRPNRLKAGNSMTLATLERGLDVADYRRWKSTDNRIDVEATLKFLSGIEEAFKRTCDDHAVRAAFDSLTI